MDQAFRFYFMDNQKITGTVRLDADVWSPDFSDDVNYYDTSYETIVGNLPISIKAQNTYIDERGVEEYNKYKKYFVNEDFSTMEF